MNKSIYLHELRVRWRSVWWWSFGVTMVALVYLAIYPSFADQAALVDEMMANFPPEFLAAFGMRDVNFASVMGFYTFVFLFVQILLSIQASNYGVGLVSIEETEYTADFLLTRPISRQQILTSKLLAALTSLGVTYVVAWVATFGFINAFRAGNPYEPKTIAIMLGGLAIFQLFFLTVGLAISQLVKRVRSVTPIGLGLGFGMYVLNAFSGLMGDIKLEWITPFKHFDGNYIVTHGALDTKLVLLSVAVILIATAYSYWRYLSRDIHAVV